MTDVVGVMMTDDGPYVHAESLVDYFNECGMQALEVLDNEMYDAYVIAAEVVQKLVMARLK